MGLMTGGAIAPDDDQITDAVTLLHDVARGWPRRVSPNLRRIVLGDAATVDAICAIAAGAEA